MAMQRIAMARTCLYGYQGMPQVPLRMYEFLPFVFVPCIHFGEAKVGYRHYGLGSYSY